MFSHQFVLKLWYDEHPLSLLLLPFSWLYILIITVRRLMYKSGLLPMRELAVPVIVIGNITVGGTGKTPLVIWLADFLQKAGYRPGIVSRGYGGIEGKWPQQVRTDSNPVSVGDEAVLLAQRAASPVVVSAKRYLAAQQLLEHHDCDILLSDDGLQHYGLHRDIEIAVVDGDRRFGNGRCLPAGPLREPISRLASVDLVVGNAKAAKNEYLMEYHAQELISLSDKEQRTLDSLSGQEIHAVAGLGNPERFFSLLHGKGIRIIKHEFPDHYQYSKNDLVFDDGLALVMTEKDAVKCRQFNLENAWYLPIEATVSNAFEHRLNILLKEISDG